MDDARVAGDSGNIERRRFIQGALVVGWATPAILTLTASRAGAVTCITANNPCSLCDEIPCCPNTPTEAEGCCCGLDPDVDCNAFCTSSDAACENDPTDTPPGVDMFCFVTQGMSSSSLRRSSRGKVRKHP